MMEQILNNVQKDIILNKKLSEEIWIEYGKFNFSYITLWWIRYWRSHFIIKSTISLHLPAFTSAKTRFRTCLTPFFCSVRTSALEPSVSDIFMYLFRTKKHGRNSSGMLNDTVKIFKGFSFRIICKCVWTYSLVENLTFK